GGVLGIDDLEDPSPLRVTVNLHPDRNAVAGNALAERGIDEVGFVAADCYRKVIEFTRANPEDYDAAFADTFLERIVKLETSATEAERAVKDADRFG
ncbi:MAG TPA: hypothetical protein VLJ62_05335, partial [Burkholderiaceae bacterium]|nr:hypothetical protein [Burkholderiaceae bacterium]